MSSRNTTRTAVLSVVVFLALAAVVAVSVLLVRDRTSSTGGAPPTTTVVATPTTSASTPTSTTTTSTPTPTPESTRARPTGAPGSVIYQLTGDGEVVGVTYRSGDTKRVVVVTGTPWQQRTTVSGRRSELSGIVVRGRITCTIMHGEELLASSTSGGGPFTCKAKLPR